MSESTPDQLSELERIKNSISELRLGMMEALTQVEIDKAVKAAKRKRNAMEWFGAECEKITQWQRDLADDLRGVFLSASRRGLKLEPCLRFAEVIGKQSPEFERLRVDALAAVEQYRLFLTEREETPVGVLEETARRQRGLELWNAGSSWPEVTEAVYGTREIWQTIKSRISRYAKDNNLFRREGTSGAKSKN